MLSLRSALSGVCGISVLSLGVLSFAQQAQDSKETTASKEENVVHIGVAIPYNRSRHIVDSKWAQSQLVRELKMLRKDKHSPLLLDAVALDSSDRDDAREEAEKKECDYLVTILFSDPAIPGEVTAGPGGMQHNPQIIGNANPRENLAAEFAVLRLGSARNLAEGVTAVPAGDDAISAASDAMRTVATRVAHEIRKQRPPAPE
ncbi:MAG TPA: hypothetical protein VMH85_04980 [Terriglobales bacterium]|nr:hypothetical protein [Terriglobales bacterium]